MNNKQIKEKSEELVRNMRLYVIGLQPPIMVKNSLKCLFTDVYLDTNKKHSKPLGFVNGDFDQLWEEMDND